MLPKRIALPVFASDALSSVAYAPEEIFLVLSVAGLSAYAFSSWIGIAVAVVMAVVVTSYRQNVHAYPSGGGDYEVATKNLGVAAGLTVGSALIVDYVLTVAVSISSAAQNIGSAVPFIDHHKVLFATAAIVILTAVNLRGLREAGVAFAIPAYAFIVCLGAMVLWGLIRIFVLHTDLRAPSSNFELHAEQSHLAGLAFVFLIARAFSSGCAALTGVEAISNGVPAFRKPKSRNAATTLLMLGAIAITLFMGMIVLAERLGLAPELADRHGRPRKDHVRRRGDAAAAQDPRDLPRHVQVVLAHVAALLHDVEPRAQRRERAVTNWRPQFGEKDSADPADRVPHREVVVGPVTVGAAGVEEGRRRGQRRPGLPFRVHRAGVQHQQPISSRPPHLSSGVAISSD